MKIQVVVQELDSFPNSVGTTDKKFMDSALNGTDDIITLLEKLSPNFLSSLLVETCCPIKQVNGIMYKFVNYSEEEVMEFGCSSPCIYELLSTNHESVKN